MRRNVAGLGRAVTPGDQRRVDVTLHLAQRDRRRAEGAVGETHGVPGVLPSLVLQAAIRRTLVLDEPVAVAIAVVVDPRERGVRGREQRVDLVAA